jgi:hypothetical protein
MLKPAILYKEELEKKFAEYLYTENYFYYTGYSGCNTLPEIKCKDDVFDYVFVDSKGELVGYFSYRIDLVFDTVCNFGLFSFQRGKNLTVPKDLFEKMEELVSQHRRIEWRVIGGNPVIKHYDAFCEKHHGHKCVFHDVVKDLQGNYCDNICYEILNPDKK